MGRLAAAHDTQLAQLDELKSQLEKQAKVRLAGGAVVGVAACEAAGAVAPQEALFRRALC